MRSVDTVTRGGGAAQDRTAPPRRAPAHQGGARTSRSRSAASSTQTLVPQANSIRSSSIPSPNTIPPSSISEIDLKDVPAPHEVALDLRPCHHARKRLSHEKGQGSFGRARAYGWPGTLDPAPTPLAAPLPTVVVTLDGSISVSGDTISWRYTWVERYAGAVEVTETYTDIGSLTITSSTAVGHAEGERIEQSKDGVGKTTGPFSLAWAADIDATYSTGCNSLITGGTFEAKLVWVQEPPSTSTTGDFYADRAVKFTYSSCGTLTGQFSPQQASVWSSTAPAGLLVTPTL